MSAAGITPRTVEALERDEIVDIYENRVAARLIDDVRRHLRAILSVYAELAPLVQHVVGPYRKRSRLATLWGSQAPDDGLRDALLRRRLRVESLLRLVDELRDSKLYEGVPRRSEVSQPIRMTNLLEQDTNYRGVRRLWLEWWNTRGKRATPEEQRAQRLNETEGFFDFAWLVVCHAVSNLGLRDDAVPEGHSFAVDSAWGTARVEKADPLDEGAWVVGVDGTFGASSLLVVAVACELLKMPTSEANEALAVINRTLAGKRDRRTMVLLPGSSHDYEALDVSVRSSPLFNPLISAEESVRGDVWVVPVSPLDLESTERVERVIRWHLLSHALLSYPPELPLARVARNVIGPKPFLTWSRDETVAHLTSVPTEREIAELHQTLEQERRRLQQLLRGEGELDKVNLSKVEESILAARVRLLELSTCPVCMATGRLIARSANTFEITCGTCVSKWGLRHDPRSSDRVPYLWIGEDVGSLPTGPGLSRWLGRDLLAEPCQSVVVGYGTDLINPWSGLCTAGAQARAVCARCSRVQIDGSGQ